MKFNIICKYACMCVNNIKKYVKYIYDQALKQLKKFDFYCRINTVDNTYIVNVDNNGNVIDYNTNYKCNELDIYVEYEIINLV